MTTPRVRTLVVSLMAFSTLATPFAHHAAVTRTLALRPAGAPITRSAPVPGELRATMLALVNRSRESRGLPALFVNEPLSREALSHSRKMARDGAIFHTPNLADLIRGVGGTVFGEDLGKGRGLQGIRDAWLRKPDTRRILLDPRFSQVGLGVVHTNGFYWVTLQAFD